MKVGMPTPDQLKLMHVRFQAHEMPRDMMDIDFSSVAHAPSTPSRRESKQRPASAGVIRDPLFKIHRASPGRLPPVSAAFALNKGPSGGNGQGKRTD